MFTKRFLTLFSLSLVTSSPLPEADPAPSAYASDYTQYYPAPVAVAPQPSQYHSQDDIGQYTFGYESADQTKQEVKTADGVIRGAYSYVDANGLTQTVNYIADALGFRVAATNLPVHDVPEEVAAPQQVMAAKVDSYAYLPYAQSYEYTPVAQTVVAKAAPVVAQAAPVVAQPAPVAYTQAAPVAQVAPVVAQAIPVVQAADAVTGSQYHAQDEVGQYSFGYNDPNSIRQEIKTADGVVRGAYKYVDTDGVLQTVEYIADGAGFRVAATNLPSAQAAPVVDTPEVAAAKAAHFAAIEEERSAQIAVAPVVTQAAPVVAQAAPVVAKAAPVVAQAAPVVAQAAPVVAQTVPVTYAQTVPVVAQAAPVVAQAAPVVAQVAPVVQAAPVVAAAAPEGSQYHAQDDFGQYSFGYSDGNSVKQEVKTADGVIRGAYSYVDADGIVQTVNYIADALGFRVGATNLPVHHVDAEPVAAAAPVAVAEEPVAEAASAPVQVAHSNHHVMTPAVNYAYLPYATNYAYETPAAQVVAASPVVAQASPVVAQASPVVAAAPVESVAGTPYDATNTQYHAQDDIGQFNYGYSNPLSTKQELKTADGVTRGSYSYVDANGIVQTVNYLSDALGFKVAATNLPVGPAPEHPVDHVEPAVVEAYSSPAVEEKVMEPTVQYAYLPYAQNYEYYGAAKPVAQATPVTYTQTAPVVAQAAPVTYAQAAPVVAQAAPVVAQAAPVVAKAAPVVAQVAPIAQAAPVVAQVAPVVQAAPVVAAASPEGSQYHAQDDIGQYSFGYSDGNSVKQEVKTADGVIRGAYSYVDADGIVQTVNYIADALGFRVGATNLPVHHVDAEPAPAAAPVAVAEAPVAAPATQQQVVQAYHPYASSYTYAEPVVAQAAPVVAQAAPVAVAAAPVEAAPAVAVSSSVDDAANSQYHAQDDIGQFNYGYSNPLSTKQELKTADGVTRGSYSYVDANGIVQTVNYLSDAAGFRVAATNLPVHNVEGAPAAPAMTPVVSDYAYLPYASTYGYNVAAPAA